MRRPLKKLLISPIALAFAVAWVAGAHAASKGRTSSAMGGGSGASGSLSSNVGGRMGSFTSRAEIKGNKTVPAGNGGGAPTGTGPVSGGPTTSAGAVVGGKPSSAAAAKTFGGFGRPLKAKRAPKLKPLSGL